MSFRAVDGPIEGLALRLQLADCVELAGERLATPRQSVPATPPGFVSDRVDAFRDCGLALEKSMLEDSKQPQSDNRPRSNACPDPEKTEPHKKK